MNMIEKVARNMCEAEANNFKLAPHFIEEKWTYESAMWLFRAKAAIAAMREPTEEMIEACMLTGGEKYNGPSKVMLKEIWKTQIDAALKE